MYIINEERMNKSQLGNTTMLIKIKKLMKNCSALAGAMLFSWGVNASQLQSIDYNVLPGDKVMVRLSYSDVPPVPQEFTTANPARISMDFAGVDSGLDYKTKDVGVGAIGSITAVEAQDRTRVVINLSELVSFNSQVQGNDYVITLDAGASNGAVSSKPSTSSSYSSNSQYDIAGVDFRRGTSGEGRVLVNLGAPNVSVDLRQEGRTVIADFIGSDIDPNFIRRLDVIDFGTPAQLVETTRRGDNVRLSVRGNEAFEYLAYQADDLYTIELKPLTKQEVERREREKPKYTGEKLTLQFQDMDLKAILHTLGDFAGINIVISDDVQGSMALNLVNVPWDQALDIILKSKGLDKRQDGNVMMIAPADVIAAREQQELEANKQVEELAPLRTELIQVNYAKAAEVAALLSTSGGDGDDARVGVLSDRGAVSVDVRTNTLIVKDVATKIEDVRRLVAQLDIPVEQVLIEARIVTASDGFARDLGVRFGVSDSLNSGEVGVSGNSRDAGRINGSVEGTRVQNDGFNVNLPVANPAGSLGLSFARLADGIIIDMELSALETENRGEVVASPKVITANQKEAFIKAGEEIPYLQGGSSGASNIQFKEAVLLLKVTPQITPDGRVFLDLNITQDTRGEEVLFTTPDGFAVGGAPAINTQEIGTQILVDNGETIVLGGIFQHRTSYDETKVPLLGDIPFLGWLFRNTSREDSKEELLIFVTPKIIKQGLKN